MITRLGHATVYVLDQDVAYDFYVNKLGFTVNTDAKMDNGFRWLTVNAPKQPDLEIILMKVEGGGSPISDEVAERLKWILQNGRLGVGVFDTDDCWATYRELSAKGVKFQYEPKEAFYGIETILEDPFGNWFSLTQRK
jgi:catechol 2,3-dioxygenase-like lactoylglutathione lyase family enzyme